MPGANCSIYNCSTSRSLKFKGTSIFKIPAGTDEFNVVWRQKLINVVTKDRVIDQHLKKQIEENRIYICEKHFEENQINDHANRKTLIPGSIPTKQLPQKSIVTKSQSKEPRASAAAIANKRTVTPSAKSNSAYYSCLQDVVERVKKLKLNSWMIDTVSKNGHVKIWKVNEDGHILPEYELFIDQSLAFHVRVYGWELPVDHKIYMDNKRSLRNITVSNLVSALGGYDICSGIDNLPSMAFIKHIVPKYFEPFSEKQNDYPLCQTEYTRAESCKLLVEVAGKCENCTLAENKEINSLKKKETASLVPAKLKAPISQTSSKRIISAMKQHRLEKKELQETITQLKEELANHSVPLNAELNNDFVSIMENADEKDIPQFMKLFWREQQQYIHSSKSGIRYHPMVIRFCLNLASKSPAAYEELRYNEKTQSGVLILPSQRTLRSYKNYIRPKQGFNKEIVEELCKKVENFSDIERNVVVLIDEMKIQENLVWDKYSGELIGFVDLGDSDLNYATLKKVNTVASHVLVLLVRGVVNPFKYSFANFATANATSPQLFAIFWKAIGILELTCALRVVAVTCDGAAANRKFYRMHSYLLDKVDSDISCDVTYKTLNVFANDHERYIYFFADPPHLVKTARNCLSKSGANKSGRQLWNDGMYLFWSHISDIFYEDLDCGLHLLPRLSYDHIKLNPFSCMNVRLAAQVLSDSVRKVLATYGPPDACATSKFCLMMDGFFDCVNVRNTAECIKKQKPFLKPFSSVNDERFVWLKEVFLKYFSDWLQSINVREGNFSKGNRGNMFISWQTYEGLQLTTHSVIELTKYLLSHGVPYVLTERFCQDPLENYFGRQRSMGRRKDNPSLRDFGFNDNSIRNQKIFHPIAGNCRAEEPEIDMDISS